MKALSPVGEGLVARAHKVRQVAAEHADDVDRKARFPVEALAALRQERLLGAYVPAALGGEGATISDIAAVCEALARGCSTTGMVYAMHQIQVACIVRHAQGDAFFAQYLREMAERQPLVASATSEAGVGGDTRRSICAVVREGNQIKLDKNATVISYGAQADDILATARRAPDAVESDQALVLVRKAEYSLEPTSGWDTLGMRGTCSLGFMLRAASPADHVLSAPFADVSAQTMAPVSHILWASVWLGIATEAVHRARETVRAEAKKKPGSTPASASRLAELVNRIHTMRAAIWDAVHEYERRLATPEELTSLAFSVRMNNLKIAASEAVVEIVSRALLICGIAGYRYDSKVSVGRQLRDAYSAGVMILNDRLYATNATLLLAVRED